MKKFLIIILFPYALLSQVDSDAYKVELYNYSNSNPYQSNSNPYQTYYSPTCSGITKSGYQCKRAPSKNKSFCSAHDPTKNNYDYSYSTSNNNSYYQNNLPQGSFEKPKCVGTTKQGLNCSRNAQNGTQYCSQHSPSQDMQFHSVQYCGAITKSGKSCRVRVKYGNCSRHRY